RPDIISLLLSPLAERFIERLLAGIAFFHGEQCARAILIEQGDIEPSLLLEIANVILRVWVDSGKPKQEEAWPHVGDAPDKLQATGVIFVRHEDFAEVHNP